MKNSALGVFNGNSKIREYMRDLQEARSAQKLCVNCGGAVKSLPLDLVGKTELCYSCHYAATQELMAVESTYGKGWEQDADSLREILTNGDSMVLNQSGVEIADAVEYDAEWEAHCNETSATRAGDYPY